MVGWCVKMNNDLKKYFNKWMSIEKEKAEGAQNGLHGEIRIRSKMKMTPRVIGVSGKYSMYKIFICIVVMIIDHQLFDLMTILICHKAITSGSTRTRRV